MQEIRLNLTPLREVLKILGSPHLKIPTAAVAGTNGKGSVCAFIKAVMDSGGIKTGLYTSPHFESPRERIKYERHISPREYDAVGIKIRRAEKKAGESLTKFEFTTAAALMCFFEKKSSLNIMEAGMGGRLDATNVCENKIVSVITPVGMDHAKYLGEKKDDIAREKAGIISKGSKLVDASGCGVVEKRARELHVPVKKYGREFSADNIRHFKDGYYSFDYISPELEIKNLQPSLRGSYQCVNASVAIAACRLIDTGIGKENIKEGVRRAKLPGRLQIINLGEGKRVVLDTAHNPPALRKLRSFIRKWLPGGGEGFYPGGNFKTQGLPGDDEYTGKYIGTNTDIYSRR